MGPEGTHRVCHREGDDMGIGLGIFLLVVGAIFTFTPIDSNWFNTNLNTVGIILMLGGALALIMAVIMNGQRNRTQHTVVQERRGGPDIVEERRDDRY
jgi:uncharacterized membrane protein HdeD (DUF308 family)